MPKLIDYPRTSYTGAWELAEVVDDTGGKCEIGTASRKLNRKVSGSFKAIIGSAVKFGLLTSKRELLSTTTLFKRIKHAYDKKEELLFHREAFLTPPLFAQICRKFRLRELPVQMLDVMLIREFGVEEINAQSVAKAFVEGCRMVNLLDDRNTMADIDANAMQPRRELSMPTLAQSTFNTGQKQAPETTVPNTDELHENQRNTFFHEEGANGPTTASSPVRKSTTDAVASLFGLFKNEDGEHSPLPETIPLAASVTSEPLAPIQNEPASTPNKPERGPLQGNGQANQPLIYQLQISGPGLNSTLSILEEDDLLIAQALLEKIRRQLKTKEL